mmetsp:Transcript_31639/g.84605  ORF Transcript_31639/g.84605 Transcript_31639/m.84605 type:complete len:318 (-) Transcript_31639:260-1213(-)
MESCSEINQNDPTDGGGTELVGVLSHSLVECPICLQLLCEPLTTPCGHSFCRPCLVNTLRKSRKKCPTCRAVCHMEPETQCESIVLASIVKSCFPDQYSVRLADVEREKSSWSTILPIFFYNDTLFPYSCLALHLFEERYKVMIRRIVEASRKFCYLPNFANYEASVGDVGVVAEITDVEFMANGRANLQAKCKDRIKIVEQWEEDGTQGLRWCKVQLVVDEPPSDPSALQTCTRTCKDAYESFIDYHGETLRAQIEATYGKQPEDPEKFSFWISSILPIPYEDKQALLETSNTEERLSFCMQIMSLAITSGARQQR